MCQACECPAMLHKGLVVKALHSFPGVPFCYCNNMHLFKIVFLHIILSFHTVNWQNSKIGASIDDFEGLGRQYG